ncbi:MAG TPA: DUF1987 domain-containing protein [Bacillus bacterium]|nr:DUF1987 domain-containing protein [Bacillus sp. (in: firmicutes)]
MNGLFIEATKSTPEVCFDAENNKLVLNGQSYPENAFKFYEPILKWLDQYIAQLQPEVQVTIELSLSYINTSSSKCLMMLLDTFEEAFHDGILVQLNWYYNEDNESELECAEEFTEDMSFPFEIIACVESK